MFLWTHPLEWFPNFKQFVFNWLYRYLASFNYEDWTFMNYGYADATTPQLNLHPTDEADRYCIQLYDKVVDGVCLKDKVVLEVGCGRGGGLCYLHRYHSPVASHGVDRCQQVIAFCNSRHYFWPSSLFFRAGDAADIPFDDGMVDVVVNVESSHCYPSRLAFFREAFRVLKSGGKFCYADLYEDAEGERISGWLRDAGFAIDTCEDIAGGVLEALHLDNSRKQKLIEQKAPRWLRGLVGSFAGLVGSRVHRSFVSGARRYTRWQLTKPVSISRNSKVEAAKTEALEAAAK